MSSQYPILNNRPIDQWKVVELKEELKRRKIPVKGLKEELVRKLDEAIRYEMAMAKEEKLTNDPKPDSGLQANGSPVQEDPAETYHPNNHSDTTGKIANDNAMVDLDTIIVDYSRGTEDQPVETVSLTENDATLVDTAVQSLQMEDATTESHNMTPREDSTFDDPNTSENHEDSKAPVEDAKDNPSEPEKQVPVVNPDLGSPVKSESITTDYVSINEKNNLKDNLNADNFHLELEVVKPEMVQPSSSSVPLLDGDVHPSDDEKIPAKNLTSLEQIDTKDSTELHIAKKEDTVDVGSPEKLNLDRSSGDESMDEDVIEAKHVEPSIESVQLGEESAVIENSTADKATDAVAVVDGTNLEMTNAGVDEKSKVTAHSEKRKLEDQSPVCNTEHVKRQRRWIETLKTPEPQASNINTLSTPKDALQPIPGHTFTRTKSNLTGDAPKERFVPPSQKPATTSLRIDKFVRPFTLKAVQEMLGKKGTVCSFWMDQIKTHCYVTYSSVEEAVATRNAVYNLQWPSNGGNLLVAEFVDPQEVKMRAEAPAQLPSPISPNPNTLKIPAFQQSQPAQPPARQQVLPPPPPLTQPPPPLLAQPLPLSDSSFARKDLPIPPPTKPESPSPTLDDLFKKTKVTPRIYYLPLTDEQVAAKLATPGKS